MPVTAVVSSNQKIDSHIKLQPLITTVLSLSFLNLFLLSLIGTLLRSFPLISSFPLSYKNILHGHSHFAFGGWIMPVLFGLFLKYFPVAAQKIQYHHWRNIASFMFASAYGMLFSFPVQGYKAVSITFSTLSILASFYLAVMTWKSLKDEVQVTSNRFIKWGMVYCVLSSLGPFATAPLIVMGKAGSILYFDAIYFFLHFQYNGFFIFFVLGIFYRFLEKSNHQGHGKKVFQYFNISCIPTFALSLLWSQPPVWVNIIGGIGALLQLAALIYLIKDIRSISWKLNFRNSLMLICFLAFSIKLVLQVCSALPSVASMAFEQRNFVIAYLHLVLLGFVSLFVIAMVVKKGENLKRIKNGVLLFLVAFVSTETLLLLNAFSVHFHSYPQTLLILSCLFPLGIFLMYQQVSTQNKKLLLTNGT